MIKEIPKQNGKIIYFSSVRFFCRISLEEYASVGGIYYSYHSLDELSLSKILEGIYAVMPELNIIIKYETT